MTVYLKSLNALTCTVWFLYGIVTLNTRPIIEINRSEGNGIYIEMKTDKCLRMYIVLHLPESMLLTSLATNTGYRTSFNLKATVSSQTSHDVVADGINRKWSSLNLSQINNEQMTSGIGKHVSNLAVSVSVDNKSDILQDILQNHDVKKRRQRRKNIGAEEKVNIPRANESINYQPLDKEQNTCEITSNVGDIYTNNTFIEFRRSDIHYPQSFDEYISKIHNTDCLFGSNVDERENKMHETNSSTDRYDIQKVYLDEKDSKLTLGALCVPNKQKDLTELPINASIDEFCNAQVGNNVNYSVDNIGNDRLYNSKSDQTKNLSLVSKAVSWRFDSNKDKQTRIPMVDRKKLIAGKTKKNRRCKWLSTTTKRNYMMSNENFIRYLVLEYCSQKQYQGRPYILWPSMDPLLLNKIRYLEKEKFD